MGSNPIGGIITVLLLDMIDKTSYVAVGKILGVNDDTARKHLKRKTNITP